MKRHSTSFIVRVMYIKTAMRGCLGGSDKQPSLTQVMIPGSGIELSGESNWQHLTKPHVHLSLGHKYPTSRNLP